MTGSERTRGAQASARRTGLLALLALAWCTAALAQGPSAVLERNPIRADETVRLIVESAGGEAGAGPDLGPLDRDFEVLGTTVSTQIQILNGEQSAATRWIVELAPRRSGELEVPPLSLGALRTGALTLEVLKAPAPGAGAQESVFIESEVYPKAPYVQAQVTYVLRLFHRVEILDGTLQEPRAADALMQRLGRDTGFKAMRGGREYRVIERRFAIFPQSSGALHIPAVRFDGEVADAGSGASSFGGLFMQGRRVRLRTEEYRLEVRPRPPEFPGQTWLPARNLHIVEQWSRDPPELRVGEPLTRTLIVNAAGLRGDQFPEIDVGTPEGIRVYPDQPTLRTSTDSEHVYGSREQRFALVPLRDGEITLPAVRVHWWDSINDAPTEALIPARTFDVAAAPAEATDLVSALSGGTGAGDGEAVSASADGAAAASGAWRWVSMVLFVAWAATAFAWWRSRRAAGAAIAEDPRTPGMGRARRALEAACAGGDADAARNALLDWATAAWPDAPPRSLGETARRLGPPLEAPVRELDRFLYAPGEASWNGEDLRRAAKSGLRRAARPARADAPPALPPLYPERGAGGVQRSSG